MHLYASLAHMNKFEKSPLLKQTVFAEEFNEVSTDRKVRIYDMLHQSQSELSPSIFFYIDLIIIIIIGID